jgi:hypothetical protein
LLSHIIANPSSPSSQTDLKLIEPLIILLSALANSGKNNEVDEMHRSCVELFEKASIAIEHATHSRDMHGTTESRGRESVEDFLRRIESISSGYDEDLSLTRNVSGGFEVGY